VDPDVAAEKQVAEIMHNMNSVLPVKRMEMTGFISVPHAHLGAAQGQLKKLVQVRNERYTDDGCEFEVSITPGDYDIVISTLNNLTKGEFDIKIDGAPPMSTEEASSGKKGKGGRGAKQGGGEGGRGRGKK